jgi:hypothetical protein
LRCSINAATESRVLICCLNKDNVGFTLKRTLKIVVQINNSSGGGIIVQKNKKIPELALWGNFRFWLNNSIENIMAGKITYASAFTYEYLEGQDASMV